MSCFLQKTQGGTIVLGIYFYTIYVFAVTFWNDVGDYNSGNTNWYSTSTNQYACNTLNNCFITLMRLSLYDGNGFDFLSNMSNSPWKGFAVLLILFMCFTGVVLLNGLIGIFSSAFTDKVEDEDENKSDNGKENNDGNEQDEKKEHNEILERLDRLEKIMMSIQSNQSQWEM